MTWHIRVEIPPKTAQSHNSHSVVTAGAFHSSLGNHPLGVAMEHYGTMPNRTHMDQHFVDEHTKQILYVHKKAIMARGFSPFCFVHRHWKTIGGFCWSASKIPTSGFTGGETHDWLKTRSKLKTRFSSDYLYRFHMVPWSLRMVAVWALTFLPNAREREGEKRVEQLAQDDNTKGWGIAMGYFFPAPGLLATAQDPLRLLFWVLGKLHVMAALRCWAQLAGI